MINRLDRLDESELEQRISTLEANLLGLKTAQRSGAGNIPMARVVTGNAADIAVTVTRNVIKIFEVTYTPTAAPFPTSGFVWKTFFNATLVSGPSTFFAPTEVVPSATSQQKTRIYFNTNSTPDSVVNIKVVVYAVSPGSLSIVQIQ